MKTKPARAGGRWLLRPWLRSWWLTVPEPRDLSIAWGLAYVALASAGVGAVLSPPQVVVDSYTWPTLAAVGWLLMVGAVVAMVGGWRDHWRLERIGLVAMLGATLLYAVMILTLQESGVSGVMLGYALFASIAMVIRYLMIWRFTYRPRG